MGKKRHRVRHGPGAPGPSGAVVQSGPARGGQETRAPARGAGPSLAARVAALHHLKGWRLWAANLATAIIIPTLLALILEGALRLVGYGYPTAFCLRQKGSVTYIENDKFLFQFYSRKTNLRPNPFALSAAKPAEATRIVVLGESAAAGTPDPAYNFGRILERMLRQQWPRRRCEVINAAMRGVNSHILLPAARDCCARLKPDLVVVYMGNNEAVGLYAPGPHSGRLTSLPRLLRALQWVRSTRLGELMDPLLLGLAREGMPPEKQDDQFFREHFVAADDPRRNAVYNNFRLNLAGLCAAARHCRGGVILMTVPVNLQDFPPLGSMHRPGLSDPDLLRWQAAFDAGIEDETAGRHAEAISRYLAAAALDGHFAELHFRLARCRAASGQLDQARREFLLARDWDALQFRADSRLNDVVRQTATRHPAGTVRLVDAERALAEADAEEHQIPGDRLFNDHVHPSFDGDYLLAKTLFPAVCEALGLSPGQAPLSRDECAARLAYTRFDEGRIRREMIKATSYPPFTLRMEHARRQAATEQRLAEQLGKFGAPDAEAASEIYRAAMRQFPEDWRLPYNFARLRLMLHDYPGAIQQFELARRGLPHWVQIHLGLSAALVGAGRTEEALRLLRQLQAADPQSQDIQASIDAVQTRGRGAVR